MTAAPSDLPGRAVVRSSFPTGAEPAPEGVPDLHCFLDDGLPPARRQAPRRSRDLASGLYERLSPDLPGRSERQAATLPRRIVTDEVVRAEADRDQNVYLSAPFTRLLTNALPDVVFLPVTTSEVQEALRWARETATPVTVRGAASAALGGAVPCAGGLTLDLSRLDHVDPDTDSQVCVVGAGARMRDIHRRLAELDLALPVYSSNLGGTYAGWLVGGGLGLASFGPRRAVDLVRAAAVVLPSGELVRLHADGRLDVPAEPPRQGHREVSADDAESWFRARGLEPFELTDLAGSEGVLGVVVQLVLSVGRRPAIGAFLMGFRTAPDAAAAAEWIAAEAGRSLPRPADLKLVLGSHLRHLRDIWAGEDAQPWRRRPSALSAGADMPWRRIAGPGELGAAVTSDPGMAAYLFVGFLDLAAGRAFAAAVPDLPGRPEALGEESVRYAAERFRPQQNKRLGPGLLAAEVVLPAGQVGPFLRSAGRVARHAGVELDPEVYYVGAGEALVIAGYLTDHRAASFLMDLALAPALLDLAVTSFGGRPYVLGRWQASFAAERFGQTGLDRLGAIKRALDPCDLLSRGVVLGMGLRGAPGRLVERVYRPGVRLLRTVWSVPGLAHAARTARTVLGRAPGPAHGHGETAGGPAAAVPAARAVHCVNCGECNSVCPIYHASAIRLPQTLTHHGELSYAGRPPQGSACVLLGLCMRCGNCQEVCQAGIPHLELYADMDAKAGRNGDHGDLDSAARALALVSVRGSARYRDVFLDVRPGMYLRRAPASLPGTLRFRVLRAENDAGPAATCLHCAACVPACPTGANLEFADPDARLVITDESSCIGCGACVEVCPANKRNGGQTLRVVEAPTAATLAAIAAFEVAR